MKHTILFLFISFSVNAKTQAQETQFQKGSETVVEETTEVKDGKTIKTTRAGKAKTRTGEAQVGTLEEGEIHDVELRRKSLIFKVLGFGPMISSNVGKDKLLYGGTIGQHWEVSTTGEITADIMGAMNEAGSFWNFGLGYSYIPNKNEFSPLFGGSFGMASAKGNDFSKSGFSMQVSGGARMFRLSDKQMEVVATYTTMLAEGNLSVFGAQLRILF